MAGLEEGVKERGKVSSRIGIMQGRLSPRPQGKLQAFPWASYADEFPKAARLGFHSIEWIFEAERWEQNPLWTDAGRAEIRALSKASGVAVQSVCADYFMLERLAGESYAELAKNREVLARLIEAARFVGADRILVPLLETAALDTSDKEREIVASLREAAKVAEHHGVTLALQMEIPGPAYADLIARVGS